MYSKFQISNVLSALRGHRLLQEGNAVKRLAGASVRAVGATLIVVSR